MRQNGQPVAHHGRGPVPTAAYDEIADWYEQEFLANQQVNAATVRKLGWTPVGVDLSAGMLRHARGRLATAQADAQQLPIRGGWLPAAIAVVIRPGYLDGHWTKASWTDQGVRDKVGATHRPLPELLHGFLDAGLTLERFAEGGAPTPVMLAIKARKPPFCEHRPSEWLGAHEHLDVGDDATDRSWTTQLVDAVAALLRRPGCGDGVSFGVQRPGHLRDSDATWFSQARSGRPDRRSPARAVPRWPRRGCARRISWVCCWRSSGPSPAPDRERKPGGLTWRRPGPGSS